MNLRACLEIARGAAARDFGCGQGGEGRASPQRAVRPEPTQATDKRPAARRGFAQKAGWLRCSSVEYPQGIFSFVAPRHPAFSPKTAPLGISKQALRPLLTQHHSSKGGERSRRLRSVEPSLKELPGPKRSPSPRPERAGEKRSMPLESLQVVSTAGSGGRLDRSFFPGWMLCMGLGLLGALVFRQVFIKANVESHLVPRPLVYLCLWGLVTLSSWLLFFRS